jgi:hypothetical protein
MAVTSKQPVDTERFKSNNKWFWEITNHGPIKWFLGFEIRRDRKAKMVSINQWAYIESTVEKFRLTNAKNILTPMDLNTYFSVQQCPSTINQMARIKGVLYSKVLGLVLWPTVVSCPDTAYAVGILSQFMQNTGPAHWDGILTTLVTQRICGLPLVERNWRCSKDIVMQIGHVTTSNYMLYRACTRVRY